MGDVLWSLVVLGFDCEWDVFSAEETGAPHKRQRWFCLAVANTQRDRLRQFDGPRRAPRSVPEYAGPVVVHPNGTGREEHGGAVAVRPEQPPAERAGRVMGHAEHQQRNRNGVAWDGRGQPANDGVYPPARNDRAGWVAIEASLEPAVCRDADGLAPGLDPSLFAYRNDRLRAVGNGVVPLTCALAWHELTRRAGCLI
jgi:hypothetical protein